MGIRAYDVMAEWQRLAALQMGMDDTHAKGYGIWLATVIAAQVRYGKRIKLKDGGRRAEGLEKEVPGADGWHYRDEVVKAFGTPRRLISKRPHYEHEQVRQIIAKYT